MTTSQSLSSVRTRSLAALLGASLLIGSFVSAFAQSVSTVPVGAISVTINGGSVGAPVTTDFTIPLVDSVNAVGASKGAISSISGATFSVNNAGWSSGALATEVSPYAIRFTSGVAQGVTLNVVANTTDSITISETLNSLGVVTGDTVQLVSIDTLDSLFGAGTVLSGANAASADIVTLSGNSQVSYYYNSNLLRWVRTTGPTTDRGSIPIPPNSVISISRKAASFTLSFVGVVPHVRSNISVSNSGATYTNTGFPVDTTLGGLALQNAIAGWVSNASAASSDTLSVVSGGGLITYFYNGSNWQRTTGPATNRNDVVIEAGVPILIFKRGNASGVRSFLREVPYSL